MLIVGAGGLAIQNIDLLEESGLLEKAVFFSNAPAKGHTKFMNRFPLISDMNDVAKYFLEKDTRFIVLVGGPENRSRLHKEFSDAGGEATLLVSPKATIGRFDTSIGEGSVIMNQSVVESSVSLGRSVLVNIGALLTHETVIGNFCEIGPGAKLCGRVSLGEKVFVGAGAILLPGVVVGDGAVIGAGAVVTKDIDPGVKVAGSPAKPIS